jgi:ABC-type microcin C transport system permease subunit YejE
MSPASRRVVRLITLAVLVAASTMVGLAQKATDNATEKKAADKPLFIEYKGVRIGMDMDEARKKLGEPTDKSDTQDFFMFSETESCQVYYDKVHKVMAVSINYVGEASGAPLPKVVLGTDIEAKADGAMYKMIRYPGSGFWVSYNRTGGDDPLVTVTMQKIQ